MWGGGRGKTERISTGDTSEAAVGASGEKGLVGRTKSLGMGTDMMAEREKVRRAVVDERVGGNESERRAERNIDHGLKLGQGARGGRERDKSQARAKPGGNGGSTPCGGGKGPTRGGAKILHLPTCAQIRAHELRPPGGKLDDARLQSDRSTRAPDHSH